MMKSIYTQWQNTIRLTKSQKKDINILKQHIDFYLFGTGQSAKNFSTNVFLMAEVSAKMEK